MGSKVKCFTHFRLSIIPRLLYFAPPRPVATRFAALIRLHREQIALLREWQEALRENRVGDAERLLTALLVTVNAIAGG